MRHFLEIRATGLASDTRNYYKGNQMLAAVTGRDTTAKD
jgi:hypothetical protein